ncbi:arrestin domain-containing protein 2-like [Bolinopsis microptera]|uniref:arrestin domain-containing protein 2-like n=1 Tax=Bolinopsis microptera TaxID=2820187 RepID=UPI00307998AF
MYSFPFSFPIPSNIPSSFSGTYGKVRYFIRYRTNHRNFYTTFSKDKEAMGDSYTTFSKDKEAVGDSYTTFSKDKETVGIVVLSLQDLNLLPNVWRPVQFRGSKTFGVLTQSLPLFVEVFLPKRSYVPGEVIPINAKISNETDTAIKRCEIWIKQQVTFTASVTWKSEQTIEHFSKVKRPGFGARTHEIWNSVPYFVPALPPTDLPHCAYVSVKHWLMIKLVPVRGMDLELGENIIIGNVPVRPLGQEPSISNSPVYQRSFYPSRPSAPSAPPDTISSMENSYSGVNNHITSVKFSEVPKGDKSLGGIFNKFVSSYGTESCPPKYPVFDLNRDCVEREFEFL